MSKDTTPAAFPSALQVSPFNNEVVQYAEPGMTKREYFAARAMEGLCAHVSGPLPLAETAQLAVKAADALIAELAL